MRPEDRACREGRLEFVEFAGEPVRIEASFVVGLKSLPIRYRIAKR